MKKKNSMKNKKVTVWLCVLFLLFVIALPTVCAFIPYNEPQLIEEEYTLDYNETQTRYVVTGGIDNTTACKISKLKFTVKVYGTNWDVLFTEDVTVEMSVAGGQSHSFTETLSHIPTADAAWYEFDNFEYEYTTLYPWAWYLIGIAVYSIALAFFSKQKFYFDIDKHKVEVFATCKKATLIIDGKVLKQLAVKSRGSVESCSFKVSGKVLIVSLEMGTYLPKVNITVDGQTPEFTKIKQHIFLKAEDKKQDKPITQA